MKEHSPKNMEKVYSTIEDIILHNRIDEYYYMRNRITEEEDGQVAADLQQGLRGLEEQILQQAADRRKAIATGKLYHRKG